jgi:hypothetical protein
MMSHTPWLSLLTPLPNITVSVTLALMSSPRYWVAQPSPVLEAKMIHCVMPARSVDMFGCLFLVPLLGLSDHLTLYTVTFRPPLFSVSVVTSITWSSSIIALTTRGPFRCAISPTPSPSLTSLSMCPHGLTVLSEVSNVIMDVSLTFPPALSSSHDVQLRMSCPYTSTRTARPSA